MEKDTGEITVIRPGEPGYKEYAPKVDAFGGRPMSLAAALRFTESELHGCKKMKEQGRERTIPELADGSGDEVGSRPIDERIAELEQMLSDAKEVIAWAEAKRPGSSKNESGSSLFAEHKKETGKKV